MFYVSSYIYMSQILNKDNYILMIDNQILIIDNEILLMPSEGLHHRHVVPYQTISFHAITYHKISLHITLCYISYITHDQTSPSDTGFRHKQLIHLNMKHHSSHPVHKNKIRFSILYNEKVKTHKRVQEAIIADR